MAKRIYNQVSLFGPLYAYLVVVSPPDSVISDIAAIKRDLNGITAITERNLHSKAHITLTDRLTDDGGLEGAVSKLIRGQPPFPIEVNGVGMLDHGHSVTVYLKVANPEPIVRLAESLKSNTTTPHIALAKKISHTSYQALLPYLQKLDFSAQWRCSEVLVLRKLMSEKHLGFRETFRIPLLDSDTEIL